MQAEKKGRQAGVVLGVFLSPWLQKVNTSTGYDLSFDQQFH